MSAFQRELVVSGWRFGETQKSLAADFSQASFQDDDCILSLNVEDSNSLQAQWKVYIFLISNG